LIRRVGQIAAVSVVGALLALLIWQVAHGNGSQVASEVDNGNVVQAPLWTRNRVDTTGTMSLASLRGKVVVLNFWQSYCPPCTQEAPVIQAGWERWKGSGKVVFVGVDVQDLHGPAMKFINRFHITYPIVADSGSLVGHYGVTGYPETFFVDAKGYIVPLVPGGHIIGEATAKTLDDGIKQALKNPSA
jgi:cytochrome c biogenesis protein CcmG/thiol:disulfide interchange protein DsbE